jgi:hypothetical protein
VKGATAVAWRPFRRRERTDCSANLEIPVGKIRSDALFEISKNESRRSSG